MDTVELRSDTLRLEFDRRTGALVRLEAPATGWRILDRPRLGLSFRLLVPCPSDDRRDVAFARRMGRPHPGRRNNPVFGEKQALASLEVAPDGTHATFVWDGVDSEHAGRLAIRVTLRVETMGAQAVFRTTIENRSPGIVENVYAPYLGDVRRPDDAGWFKAFLYQYAAVQEWSLWPAYDNHHGYYGFDHPVQASSAVAYSGAPMSPFVLLRDARQGLYAGISAPSPELVVWHTELRPAYESSIDHRVPVQPTIDGIDVATRFAAVHLPYVLPGETRELTPVTLQAFQGGWQRGADIYKAWRDTWMTIASPPQWAIEPHAWQQIHINSPEDELRTRFSDLPKLARECARHGIGAIQLVGWNDGGQDQGNPSHDPDPRLGTFDELREAIARCRQIGVKIILFAKFTWSDRATPRFRDDLHRLAIKDPYGDWYLYPGYRYQTATQMMDVNTKRLIPMCFLSEEYRGVCDEEFRKIVALGADGILFDECQHHGPALLCFDTAHGHRYGAPVYANDRLLIHGFARIARPERPDFLFAGEAVYDWGLEAYQLSYHRSESTEHVPLSRYLQPHAQLMTAVTGWNDRNMINQCLLYRYLISYEPFNFKGRLEDFPRTVAYGRTMDALRTELRRFFWDGTFRDTVGARVTSADGTLHHPYSVFVDGDGVRALAIANYGEGDTIVVRASLDDGKPLARYRLVDAEDWQPTGDGIRIPPWSAAVVI
jgi:hypothetical protein